MSVPLTPEQQRQAAAAAAAQQKPAGNTTAASTRSNAFVDEGPLVAVKSDPNAALALFQSFNGGPSKAGRFGKFREGMMAKALQAYLSMLDLGGNAGGNPLALANQGTNMFLDKLSSGQGVGGFLRENADRILHGTTSAEGTNVPQVDFSNMDSDQIMNIMSLISGAATFGSGPMGQYESQNALDDMQYQSDLQGLTQPQAVAGQPKNASVLNTLGTAPGGRQNFQNLIQRYLALK